MKRNHFREKGLVIGIILMFVGTSIIPATAQNTEKTLPASRGKWLYVGGSGPGNYTRIQDAIDNASDGDTVFVYDDLSPYREHIRIIKSLSITGENKNTTEIYGIGDNKDLLSIESKYTIVSNFTIRYGSDRYTGIYIKNSSYITIMNCRFSNIPSMDAVTVGDSENITILNCIISDSIGKDESGSNNKYISGVTLESGCINTTISGNTISNATWAGIVALNECQNIRILGNIIFSNDGFGIDVQGCDSLYIKQNTIINNHNLGIALLDCNNTLISMNLCEKNGYAAVEISDSMNTYIESNNFIKNGILGFFYFDYGKGFSNHYPNNKWEGNYWDRPRIFPKPLFGVMTFKKDSQSPGIIIPWFMFDYHPAQEPYEIPAER